MTETCSVCGSEFDVDGEGGISGYFGICYVSFCPWCYSSMVDMVFKLNSCPHCEKPLDEDEDEEELKDEEQEEGV